MSATHFLSKIPNISDKSWVAESATVLGDVVLKEHSSIWYQSVIRGDVNSISIGRYTNIQDASIIHGSTGGVDTIIGDYVTVGHRAIVHGCTIHDYVLIGMGAILLDNALVNSDCIVAAGAVVSPRSVLEGGFIYAGVPARKLKAIDINEVRKQIILSAEKYVDLSQLHKSMYS